MPISKYFGGHGAEVASNMQKQYGNRWKEVFYATANKQKQAPAKKSGGFKAAAERLK